VTTPPPAETPSTVRARAAALGDRVPTKWLVTGIAAVFLAGSAAFGGLETAAPAPLPEVEAGEAFTGAELRIAVERVALIDGFPEQYIEPETEGNRLLVVVATVENVWDTPVSTLSDIGAADNLRPVGVPGLDASSEPLTVAVLDDGSQNPELQPGVPIELAFMWEVAPDAVADGDEIRLDLYDKTYQAEGFVTYGERFIDPFVAAYTTLPVDDVGAGV
jgi:hypothetical protein